MVIVRLPSITRASVTDWKKPELTLPNDMSTARDTGVAMEVSLIPRRRTGVSPGDTVGMTSAGAPSTRGSREGVVSMPCSRV